MAIDFDELLNWKFEEQRHVFTRRDTILYALGVGLGVPACSLEQLPFLYEEGLRALPTMAAVLGYQGFWMKDPATGIDWRRVLHGEQSIALHKALPVEGTVVSRVRVSALIDKGREKGAILAIERQIRELGGDLLATVEQVSFLRGDGGFGKSSGSLRSLQRVPEREPDIVIDLPTCERAALIYRLSGDYNPLHIDPQVAAEGGFSRPILHGLCTFGVVGHALLKGRLRYQEERLRGLRGRFTAPVYPGETIRTELWNQEAGRTSIRARAVERDVLVFDQGCAEFIA